MTVSYEVVFNVRNQAGVALLDLVVAVSFVALGQLASKARGWARRRSVDWVAAHDEILRCDSDLGFSSTKLRRDYMQRWRCLLNGMVMLSHVYSTGSRRATICVMGGPFASLTLGCLLGALVS